MAWLNLNVNGGGEGKGRLKGQLDALLQRQQERERIREQAKEPGGQKNGKRKVRHSTDEPIGTRPRGEYVAAIRAIPVEQEEPFYGDPEYTLRTVGGDSAVQYEMPSLAFSAVPVAPPSEEEQVPAVLTLPDANAPDAPDFVEFFVDFIYTQYNNSPNYKNFGDLQVALPVGRDAGIYLHKRTAYFLNGISATRTVDHTRIVYSRISNVGGGFGWIVSVSEILNRTITEEPVSGPVGPGGINKTVAYYFDKFNLKPVDVPPQVENALEYLLPSQGESPVEAETRFLANNLIGGYGFTRFSDDENAWGGFSPSVYTIFENPSSYAEFPPPFLAQDYSQSLSIHDKYGGVTPNKLIEGSVVLGDDNTYFSDQTGYRFFALDPSTRPENTWSWIPADSTNIQPYKERNIMDETFNPWGAIFAWDGEKPSVCRQRALSLGFSPLDLQP